MPSTLDPRPSTCASRAALLSVSAVQGISGLRYDAIRKLVTGGDFFHPGFQWVWNFSTEPAGERDLRFWHEEVMDPAAVSGLGLGDVLARILPLNRQQFPAGEVTRLFTLTPTALMRLRDQLGGRLGTSGSFYPRYTLDNFLRTRWIGANISVNHHVAASVARGGSPPAPEKDTVTRQSALNGKHASIPARKLSIKR